MIKRFVTQDNPFGYLIEATLGKNELYVEITAWRVTATGDEPPTEVPEDCREIMFKGSVKWDGCSNYSFGPCAEDEHSCLMHFCEPQHALDIGKALVHAYEMSRDLLGDKADSYADWTV